jgi:hypothetical protein
VVGKVKDDVADQLAGAMVGNLAPALHAAHLEAVLPSDSKAIADFVQRSLESSVGQGFGKRVVVTEGGVSKVNRDNWVSSISLSCSNGTKSSSREELEPKV